MLDPLPASAWSRRTADHLLSRAAFGGTPAQREAFYILGRDQGISAAVNSLVDVTVNWDAQFPFPAWTASEASILSEYPSGSGAQKMERWYYDLQLRFTDASTAIVVANLAPPSAPPTYAAWATANIPSGKPTGAESDADADGAANVTEYVFATNPATGVLPIPLIGVNTLQIQRRAGVSEYQCVLETSPDLVNWTSRPGAEDTFLLGNGMETVIFYAPPITGRAQFMRVRISPP